MAGARSLRPWLEDILENIAIVTGAVAGVISPVSQPTQYFV